MFTGFQHDLKAVCDLAHANGAVVYADVAQSAGCTPIDVKATKLDFCACSSFKWLMGDFGLGFLYVREDLMDRVIRRSDCSYYQASSVASHFYLTMNRESPLTYELSHDAAGHFEVSTLGYAARAALGKSLPYIRELGRRQHRILSPAHASTVAQGNAGAMGFEPMTPPESRSALISFACKDATCMPIASRKQTSM